MKNLQIEKQNKGIVVIRGELPWEEFTAYRPQALARLSEIVAVDGFRKGQVPEDILVKKVGALTVLEEMASLALQSLYPKIVLEHKIDVVGRPSIEITKLADTNPLGFTITTASIPEIALPDYKSISRDYNKTKQEVSVEDSEVEGTIQEILTMRAKQDLFKKMQEGKEEHVHDEHCNHDHDEPVENNKDESIEDVQKRIDEKLVLPELNDEFVKTLGDFADVSDFKAKLKENILQDKKRKEEDKQRLGLLDALLAKTPMDLPDVIVDSELASMMQRIRTDVEGMGMKFEEYLARVSKTEEDLKNEMRPDALKRAQIQMLVSLIARQEKITPEENRLVEEVTRLKEHYKDIDEHVARDYVGHILTNDAVFKMLDSQ